MPPLDERARVEAEGFGVGLEVAAEGGSREWQGGAIVREEADGVVGGVGNDIIRGGGKESNAEGILVVRGELRLASARPRAQLAQWLW